MSIRYETHLRRSGRWWAVDVPALSIYTQARTLDEAESVARDAIAATLDVPAETVAVDLMVPEAADVLRAVHEARARCAAAVAAEQQALTEAARALVTELGLSQRDASRLLGIPHQAVSQLAPVRV